MKKILILLTCIISFIACDYNNDSESNYENESLLSASNNKSFEGVYGIAELQLHQYYIEYQLATLSESIEDLLVQIENGDESKIPALEQVQQAHEENLELFNLNDEFISFIRLPKPPIPHPCDPELLICPQVLTLGVGFNLFVIEEFGDISVSIQDLEGFVVSDEPHSIEQNINLQGILIYTFELPIEAGIINITKQNPINGQTLSYNINFVTE